jgi:uncharacterized membrane protein AbrB (regulator of aidB expression)
MEREPSTLAEFLENFFAGFMTFSYCIGGWLVHFGMSAGWMFGLSAIIAALFALTMNRR